MSEPTIPIFDVDDHENISQKWLAYSKRIERLCVVKNIADNRKIDTWLLYAGQEIESIYDEQDTRETEDNFESIVRKISEILQPRGSVTRNIFDFRSIKQ